MPFGYNCVRNDALDGYSTGIEMWQTLVVVKTTDLCPNVRFWLLADQTQVVRRRPLTETSQTLVLV